MEIKKGSFTVEAACVMSLVLLAVVGLLYLCFFVHNRSWLTAAAYEAALAGSMEGLRQDGNMAAASGNRSQELGNIGFFGMENLRVQVQTGKDMIVTYTADTAPGLGGLSWKLRVEGKAGIIDPVNWVRKMKMTEDVLTDIGGS